MKRVYPKVSVIIPFYKGVNWLKEAVDSVLAQDYHDLEIILVNDGSPEDLTEFYDKYKDLITIINQVNRGPAAARNTGINAANGKYIALLDADDLWMPGKLRCQIEDMEQHNAVWGQHSSELFWENSNKKKIVDTSRYQGNVRKETFVSFKVQTGTFMIRRQELNQFHIRYPEGKRYGEDDRFYYSLACRWPLYYTKGVFLKVRIRGSNAAQRAQIQLLNRASVYQEFLLNKEVDEHLPLSAEIGFKLSFQAAKVVRKIKNTKNAELVSKILYLAPYVLFKIADHSLKRERKC